MLTILGIVNLAPTIAPLILQWPSLYFPISAWILSHSCWASCFDLNRKNCCRSSGIWCGPSTIVDAQRRLHIPVAVVISEAHPWLVSLVMKNIKEDWSWNVQFDGSMCITPELKRVPLFPVVEISGIPNKVGVHEDHLVIV
ncbi:hypothetical protein SDJN02_14864, partial [Cucurbita argyrosperma subsp. argyrosperma]